MRTIHEEEESGVEAFMIMITSAASDEFATGACTVDGAALPPPALPRPEIPGGHGHLRGITDEEAGNQNPAQTKLSR